MKVIKESEHLIVSGENLYDSPDTVIYWNSIDSNNIAQIVGGSFQGNSSVKVVVPCCLPDTNKVVVCNYVGCYTGAQSYRYVSKPQIDKFSPTSQDWEKQVVVRGKYFDNITGVYAGDIKVDDYNVSSNNRLIFNVPNGLNEGLITIYTDVGSTVSTQKITGRRPDLAAVMKTAPKYYGETGVIEGKSLDLINRIAFQDFNGQPLYADGSSPGFKHLGTTGITFSAAEGTASNSSVELQSFSGFFSGGVYQTPVSFQHTLGSNLDLKSIYINGFDKDRQVYDKQIRVSGVNLHKSKILFKSYDDSYIEGSFVNSGDKHKTVKVPKNIKNGQLLAKGIGGDYSGEHKSANGFFPMPTIVKVNKTKWKMGEEVVIDAINASNSFTTVGITGVNKINGQQGTFFVANAASVTDNQNCFGYVTVDNSRLPLEDVTKINILVNSAMAGSGNIFLLSNMETPPKVNYNTLSGDLKNSYSFQNINDIIYSEAVEVSGKSTSILGISNPKSAASGPITISGRYFLPLTGVLLQGGTQYKRIPRSSLIDVNNQKVNISPSGNLNNYESPHFISMNVQDFNFTEKNGTFKILIP